MICVGTLECCVSEDQVCDVGRTPIGPYSRLRARFIRSIRGRDVSHAPADAYVAWVTCLSGARAGQAQHTVRYHGDVADMPRRLRHRRSDYSGRSDHLAHRRDDVSRTHYTSAYYDTASDRRHLVLLYAWMSGRRGPGYRLGLHATLERCCMFAGRGDAASQPGNQEWPFAAFSCELLAIARCEMRDDRCAWT